MDNQTPIFRATTDCPIPREWLALAFVVGVLVGALAMKS